MKYKSADVGNGGGFWGGGCEGEESFLYREMGRALRLFLVLAILFILPLGASAKQMLWSHFVAPSRWTDPSPENLCRRVGSVNYNGWIIRLEKVFISPSHFSQSKASCSVRTHKKPDSVYLRFNLYLVGGECLEGEVLNTVTGMCEPDPDVGNKGNGPSPCMFNPIDVSTGEKLESGVDLAGAGLPVARYYSSRSGLWRHQFSHRLQKSGNRIWIRQPSGSDVSFLVEEGESSVANHLGKLSISESGYVYIARAGDIYDFDALGNLLKIQPPHGLPFIIYRHLNGKLKVSQGDRYVDMEQDANGQPIKVSSSAGDTIEYSYAPGLIANKLIKVEVTRGGVEEVTEFLYENAAFPSALTGMVDPRGVRYATWHYDSQGRAISSEHAGQADRGEIAYNQDGTVSVTNELGKVAVYQLQTIGGVRHITSIQGEPSANCPSSNSSFTYDNRGLLKTRTDNKGILTTYFYNDHGLEVSRTEAAGTPQARTVTTEWHPSLFLPVVVTEPSRIIRYQYDNQGRQLSRTIEAR
ncbi:MULTISPECIES: DUF6531 domain-containing protein [unclassified Pseudomonas]|uniref:DUF6531 domain-containing protein n=1 Tax=unclassified Pseudomonas TaxID=196821 RepID=UPI002448C77E|nr:MULTISPECIES: DUF6531 domain-containing protein [unclassified Pseudomonas]MDG9926508.1 DUF6531 domain-containing protein [Pseudomonas sp. GD04042]MDH0481408.1 DUF6531 domain-containing protein [Pseudomonas sp. GD04015]MDH0603357.1 DUF6531 domain-containing protein [Pseudomonas sp. GD03869]